MEKKLAIDKTLSYMIYGSLLILALGLLTSISILSLSHILMIVPALYFLPKANYLLFSKSSWGLLAFIIVIVLSIVLNQDIIENGYKNLGKVKYFIFGFISIAPFAWYFRTQMTSKKISILIYVICTATTVATISGIIGLLTGFNYISMREVMMHRNAGLFGMLMNYAYNLSFFLILLMGLVYKKKGQEFVNMKFVYVVLIVNLAGSYLTYTRGTWLGLVAAIPFIFLKINKKMVLGAIIGLIALGAIVYNVAGEKIIRPESDNQRMSQWKAAIAAFKERPILGYGYLNFEKHSIEIKKRYNIPGLENGGGHAHSNVFEVISSTGILGSVAFLWWFIFWIIEMYKDDSLNGAITLPFIILFIVGGLTQSTISLGINLFFLLAVYAISQGVTLARLETKLKVNFA